MEVEDSTKVVGHAGSVGTGKESPLLSGVASICATVNVTVTVALFL